jgi:hypothetical protein
MASANIEVEMKKIVVHCLKCELSSQLKYRSLVSSVVIDAELGKEDHGSILRNYDLKEAITP